jgi:hypothetical protein
LEILQHFGVPPIAITVLCIVLGVVLGLRWLVPRFREYGPSRLENIATALWTARGRPKLRAQIYHLAGRVRRLASVEERFPCSSPSDTAERWRRLSPAFWAVKSAIQTHIGAQDPLVADLRKTIPMGAPEYRYIASILERIAPKIPLEAEAVPIPKNDGGST